MGSSARRYQAIRVRNWIIRDEHWSRVGLGLSLLLLLLGPLVRRRLSRSTFLVYLQLPVYMLHQYEEHGHGAFRREVNSGRIPLPGGANLTHQHIFLINMLGVWGLDSWLLYRAHTTNPAIGLVAPYLAVVNGILHLIPACATRRYNPGLWTSLLLFLPFGLYSSTTIGHEVHATRRDHARGVGIAILAHVVTVLYVLLFTGNNDVRERNLP